MSSSEGSAKKVRIIKRLDFENCVFSGVKSRSKCKSRLRARYFRDVESFDKNEEAKDLSSTAALSMPDNTVLHPKEEKSPILFTKKSAERCRTAKKSSPVFRSQAKVLRTFKSKRKINFETRQTEGEGGATSLEAPRSPVFKRSKLIAEKLPATRADVEIGDSSRNASKRSGSRIGRKVGSFESEKFAESCYRIEESSQESKQSVHISSVSSSELKIPGSQGCPLDAQIDIEIDGGSSSPGNASREGDEKIEICGEESLSPRKNFKKSGLLTRLHTILKKQNSERLLRQHQRASLDNFERLSFLHLWTADANFVLKCVSSPPNSEIKYLVIDKKLFSNVIPSLKKGSLLHLFPPWVKINFGEGKVNVFINVVYVEIVEETSSEFVLTDEKKFESVPPEQFKGCEDDLLNNAFLSTSVSPFLL